MGFTYYGIQSGTLADLLVRTTYTNSRMSSLGQYMIDMPLTHPTGRQPAKRFDEACIIAEDRSSRNVQYEFLHCSEDQSLRKRLEGVFFGVSSKAQIALVERGIL